MKLIKNIIFICASVVCLESCTTMQTYTPDQPSSSVSQTTNDIPEIGGKKWYFIKTKTSDAYLPYLTEPQYSERLGAETDLTKIKEVFLSVDADKVVPNNLQSLPNLEKLSVSGSYDGPRPSFDFSIISGLNNLTVLELSKVNIDFSNSNTIGGVTNLRITDCINKDFPDFLGKSKLEKITITNDKDVPFIIGEFPLSVKDIDINGITEKQEMQIIGQLGHKPLHFNLPSKYRFYSEDYTLAELLENKQKVVSLTIELHRKSDDYINVVDQFPNLEYLYLVSSSANELKGKTYKTAVLNDRIFDCKKLKKFKLRCDRVQYIYGDFSELKNLESLVLSAPLTKLPNFKIEGLKNLEIDLNLNYFIMDLDPSPIIDSTFNLKVDKNIILDRIIDINQIVKNHPHLKSIRIEGTSGHLGSDKLEFNSFSEYKELTALSLSMLKYGDFPAFILNNTNLKAVYLRLTYFKSIPVEITKLANLTTFTFSVNSEKLPDEFYTLKKIKYLWINGLKIKEVNPLLDEKVFPELQVLKIKDTGVTKKVQKEIYASRPSLETLWKPWED